MMLTIRPSVRKHIATLASALLTATALTVLVLPGPAQAHGNVNDPVARGYRCLKVWGNNHMDPAMQTEDPMCWQAFQTNPAAMWNWNGMLRDNLGADYKSKIADGTLCSAGNGDGGRYAPLDVPGNWVATSKPSQFRLNLVDQASHNADWIDVYVSRAGFDPTTQRLGWGDLVQVGHSGQNSGNGTVDPAVGGKAYAVDVNASGNTGRRVLFTVWKASHADQIYFLCSDVNIS
jgi:lytic cellulose monooxygenase (C4-dehydrogenating)